MRLVLTTRFLRIASKFTEFYTQIVYNSRLTEFVRNEPQRHHDQLPARTIL